MKKIILAVLTFCFMAGPAFAEGNLLGKPIQYQTIILTTASNGVTAFATPSDDAKAAIVVFEGDPARWASHDTAPTVDLGAPVYDGDTVYLDTMNSISKFRFAMKRGGSGVTAYRTVFGK
jgi:hypothetical protein